MMMMLMITNIIKIIYILAQIDPPQETQETKIKINNKTINLKIIYHLPDETKIQIKYKCHKINNLKIL